MSVLTLGINQMHIPVITSRRSIFELVTNAVANFEHIEMIWQTDAVAALDDLLTEMPQICVIDFSSEDIDAFDLLEKIRSDSWLIHGGIIAVHSSSEIPEKLDQLPGHNLIISLPDAHIARYLPVVMKIVESNRRLLVHRGLGQGLLENFSAIFELHNDVIEARCFINLVCNFLFNSGKIDVKQKSQTQLAISEMIMNAIEHGNCGISYEQKTAWLESGKDIQDLIANSLQHSPNKATVQFSYQMKPDRASFCITDQGDGFNWRNTSDPLAEDNIMALHGRGILMTRMNTENHRYNEKGNEVEFDIVFSDSIEPIAPKIFKNQPMISVSEGTAIIREGEISDCVYYIVSGQYDVIVGGSTVYTITPEDILIGEMAFLLGGLRSADVIATSAGKLIPITRKELVHSIRENPHYGLFLARLLAERIAVQNSNTRLQAQTRHNISL